MTTIRSLALLLGIFIGTIVASCHKTYNPDLSGPTAKIKIISNSICRTIVWGMGKNDCESTDKTGRMASFEGYSRGLTWSLLDKPNKEQILSESEQKGLLGIPAETPFVFVVCGCSRNWTCLTTFTFTPQHGERYEIIIGPEGKCCKTYVDRLEINLNGDTQRVAEESFKEADQQCPIPEDLVCNKTRFRDLN